MFRPPPLNASRSIQRITSVRVYHYEFTKKFYNARGAGRIDENSLRAFTLSIVAKGTPLLLGRGAARADARRRLQGPPDLVLEILLAALPGLGRLPVPEVHRVEAVLGILAPGHRAAAVRVSVARVSAARPAELLGGVVLEAPPEVELAPFLEVPRPVWK